MEMAPCIRMRSGSVLNIVKDGHLQELIVSVDGGTARAIAYPELTGPVYVGDEVLLNTTAVSLGLGSGGYHFVMARNGSGSSDLLCPGHIMKLRYTPLQLTCLSVEEEASPWGAIMAEAKNLDGMPVVAASLHSMVGVIACGILARSPKARIVYIMTDGAALPVAFSKQVPLLKERGLITCCISAGQAFGGDMEAVNVWSALLAAKHAADASHAIVAMGPGIVGTGTPFGFSGIEQGEVLNATGALGGQPVAALRMSLADARERHRGISHHTLTILGTVATVRSRVAVPVLEAAIRRDVHLQLSAVGILDKHTVDWDVDCSQGIDLAVSTGIPLSTMGRSLDEDRCFFMAAAAAGCLAGGLPDGVHGRQ